MVGNPAEGLHFVDSQPIVRRGDQMGVSLPEIEFIFQLGNIRSAAGVRILDIGCSNLYGGTAEDYQRFLFSYGGIHLEPQVREFCELMSIGAMRHSIGGGVNGAWLGELLERVGCEYTAYDIFEGYMTTLFDLNNSVTPPLHRGNFDVVINCGTTEHVLNQLNSFRVIHDAVRTGGIIYHALPMTGHLDHGYFNYNPRLFIELARANEYDLMAMEYSAPEKGASVLAKLVEGYQDCKVFDVNKVRSAWKRVAIPNSGIVIAYKKNSHRPFRLPLETSTTVGGASVVRQGSQAEKAALLSKAQEMIANLENTPVGEIETLIGEFGREGMLAAFPHALERHVLLEYVKNNPSADHYNARLRQLDVLEEAAIPLTRIPSEEVKNVVVAFDGVETEIGAIPEDLKRYRAIIHAYHQYVATGRACDFPLRLEKEALQKAIVEHPEDYDLAARLGKVVAALLAQASLPSPATI